MKTKLILPLILLFASLTVSAQKKSEYKAQVDAVLTTLNTQNADALKGYLAEGYTVGQLEPGTEDLLLPQILQQLPKFDSYEIKSETKENGNTRIKVDFIIKGANFRYPANLLIAAKSNKIQELNILEQAQVSVEEGN